MIFSASFSFYSIFSHSLLPFSPYVHIDLLCQAFTCPSHSLFFGSWSNFHLFLVLLHRYLSFLLWTELCCFLPIAFIFNGASIYLHYQQSLLTGPQICLLSDSLFCYLNLSIIFISIHTLFSLSLETFNPLLFLFILSFANRALFVALAPFRAIVHFQLLLS